MNYNLLSHTWCLSQARGISIAVSRSKIAWEKDMKDRGDDEEDEAGDGDDDESAAKQKTESDAQKKASDAQTVRALYLPVTDIKEHVRQFFIAEQDLVRMLFGALRNPCAVAATTSPSVGASSNEYGSEEFKPSAAAAQTNPAQVESSPALSLANGAEQLDTGAWFFVDTIAVPPSRFRPGMYCACNQSANPNDSSRLTSPAA